MAQSPLSQTFQWGICFKAPFQRMSQVPKQISDKSMGAYAGELVHCGKSSQNGMVFDYAVSCQGCIVAHDDIVPKLTVVGNVTVSHNQVSVSDFGDKAAVFGSSVQGCEFADIVVIADD